MVNFVLEETDGTRKMIEECLTTVKCSEKVVLFGAGVGGGKLFNLLKEHNLSDKILAWSDNNHLKFGRSYMQSSLKVVNPENLIEKYGKEISIIITSSAYDIIRDQLVSYGYKRSQIYLFNFAFMDLQYTDKNFIDDHMNDFYRAFTRMADEKSRRIFIDILNYRITKNHIWLKKMQEDVDDEAFQYFPSDLFEYTEKECFLDVGAYMGDTLTRFDEIYGGRWLHYYGLEADDAIFRELTETALNLNRERDIEIYELAAWDCKTQLSFSVNAGSSKVEDSNANENNLVIAECVDDILTDKKVTFVKMDIEGAEYHALCGMAETIKGNKPILAICVYHLRDDFYKITDCIECLVPGEYTFFLRQYRYTPTETVCYAIPKHRRLKGESFLYDRID